MNESGNDDQMSGYAKYSIILHISIDYSNVIISKKQY